MKLIIKNLKKNFEKKEVLKDINFEFEKGKIYGLLGRNGAGKTTFFNCLNEDLEIDNGEFCIEDNGKTRKIEPEDIGYVLSIPNVPEFLTGRVLPFTIGFGTSMGLPVYICLLLPIFVVMVKMIVSTYNLYYFEKHKIAKNENMPTKISAILGIFSFIKINKFNEYRKMYKQILTNQNVYVVQNQTSTDVIKDAVAKIVSIIAMSIIFSVHYLVMYYLLQPYNASTEMKSSTYKVVQVITYFVCWYMIQIQLPTISFGIATSAFCILYCLIFLILAYKYVPKTFKLRV